MSTCLAFGLLAAALPARADFDDVRKVLVIDAERGDRPVWVQFTSVFQPALRDGSRPPVDVYLENLDVARFGKDGYLSRVETWLTEKYRSAPPDVVVAVGPMTYRLIADWWKSLSPDASIVLVAVDERTYREASRIPHTTALLYEFGHVDTVRLALELLPDTRNLAIVGGPRSSQAITSFFFAQIEAAVNGRVKVIDLCGLPMDQLRNRVAELPDHTVIVMTSIFVDGDGRPFSNPEAVAELAPVANAPIFSFFATELGTGTAGGRLFDAAILGRETAALVSRILNGEPADSIDPMWSRAEVTAFDWRQLDRWHIPLRKLPPGSIVEFRPPSIWQQHRTAVLAALVVFALQGASIIALLRSRQRRRRINRELHRLSGRLITAQEDERRRVARDLHDDISQRLALLAIELESTGNGRGDRLPAALSRVQSLASDVHAIAHDLQPPRLDARGLVAELETFCRQVEERHGMTIECRVPAQPLPVRPDAALALYRVAQEAVQNAVKHSGADRLDSRARRLLALGLRHGVRRRAGLQPGSHGDRPRSRPGGHGGAGATTGRVDRPRQRAGRGHHGHRLGADGDYGESGCQGCRDRGS